MQLGGRGGLDKETVTKFSQTLWSSDTEVLQYHPRIILFKLSCVYHNNLYLKFFNNVK